jgi:hypothetical protein
MGLCWGIGILAGHFDPIDVTQLNHVSTRFALTFRLKWTQIEGLASHNNTISLQINNSVGPRALDLLPSGKEVEVLDPSRNFFYLFNLWWS